MLNVMETRGRSFSLGGAVSDLISGKLDVVWVHEFSDMKTCEKISENFRSGGFAFPRKDNVPGVMVGESHYFKTPGDYYRSCDFYRENVKALFSGVEDPVEVVYDVIRGGGFEEVRPAVFEGRESLHTRAISWYEKEGSSYLLQPHDDVSQVFCDRNQGWEISDVKTLVAINFYAKASSGHGSLRVFDLKHSKTLEEALGVSGVGYPYPLDCLDGLSYMDFPVSSGDLMMINGAYVHGVLPSQCERIVLNSFLGNVDEGKLIYWT